MRLAMIKIHFFYNSYMYLVILILETKFLKLVGRAHCGTMRINHMQCHD